MLPLSVVIIGGLNFLVCNESYFMFKQKSINLNPSRERKEHTNTDMLSCSDNCTLSLSIRLRGSLRV